MRRTGALAVGVTALATLTAAAQAAEWPRLPGAAADRGSQATVWDPGPRWPEIPSEALAARPPAIAPALVRSASPIEQQPQTKDQTQAQGGPQAGPQTQPQAETPTQGVQTPVGLKTSAPVSGDSDITGAIGDPQWPRAAVTANEPFYGPRWPMLPPATPVQPFAFEGSLRYWYSAGFTRFGFANGDPLFGNPTSTLDWRDSRGNAGELFGRIDHRPTGLFVKGVIGGGALGGGTFIDRDYLSDQIKFSDTSSDIKGDNMFYGTIDLGWALHVPAAGARVGFFAGYHVWHEKMTAYGLICNPDDVGNVLCGPPGVVVYPTSTAVLIYEPTWQALRIGIEGRYQFTPNWSVAGEAAFIPLAWLKNEDSHLLRQSFADLGPAPNVISRSREGYGMQAELFVNYAFTPNFEIGVGARYWGLRTDGGTVTSGPFFAPSYDLTLFDQSRYGLLVQASGRF